MVLGLVRRAIRHARFVKRSPGYARLCQRHKPKRDWRWVWKLVGLLCGGLVILFAGWNVGTLVWFLFVEH